MRSRSGNACFVEQVEMLRSASRTREAMNSLEHALLDKGGLKRSADAAGSADDDRRILNFAAHARNSSLRAGIAVFVGTRRKVRSAPGITSDYLR
jgi:hypothetical protein